MEKSNHGLRSLWLVAGALTLFVVLLLVFVPVTPARTTQFIWLGAAYLVSMSGMLWVLIKVPRYTRVIEFDEAQGIVRVLREYKDRRPHQQVSAPWRPEMLRVMPVEMSVAGGLGWSGYAVVLDVESEKVVMACRRHLDEIDRDIATIWNERMGKKPTLSEQVFRGIGYVRVGR